MIRTVHALAAALACGATALALAQAPGLPGTRTQPTGAEKPTYLQEPTASSAGVNGPNTAVVNAIVEAINADRSLQGSKFSVVAGDETVLLTGVTPSLQQMAQASKIAQEQAGSVKVSTVVSTEEIVLDAGAVAPGAQATASAEEAALMSQRTTAAQPGNAPAPR